MGWAKVWRQSDMCTYNIYAYNWMHEREPGDMWKFEHTETTAATAEQLWAHYADPPRWPEWDHEAAHVTVNGPMAAGTAGTVKPRNGPRVKFRFVDVRPLAGFTDVSRLPLARLTFAHRIEPTAGGCRISHAVAITGPLSPLFGRVIGRNIEANLPAAMRALARLAESTPQPATAATPAEPA